MTYRAWQVTMVLLLSFLLAAAPARATEAEATREERAAQLIHNTVHMSSETPAPSDSIIAKYRGRGSTSRGVGYRTTAQVEEDGRPMVWSFQAAFLNDDAAVEAHDQFAKEMAAKSYGTDSASGASMFVLPDVGPGKNRIWFILRQGKISLNMTIDRLEDDPAQALKLSKRRWHFFIDEAKRLGVLDAGPAPKLIVRVWDQTIGDWRTLEDTDVFSRRLARLHEGEVLDLEVELSSDSLVGDRPYVFELAPLEGDLGVSLLDSDGATAFSDDDGDGWPEVIVDPVDGKHPPRRLTAVFDPLQAGDESASQRAVVRFRFEDDTGQVQLANVLERSAIVPIFTHFELRAHDVSGQANAFLARLDGSEREAFRLSRREAPWFNGEFDPGTGDLLTNWDGDLYNDPSAPAGDNLRWLPGFVNRVQLRPGGDLFDGRVRSQASATRQLEGADGTVYLGWTLEKSLGLTFLTMEDRPGAELEIPPLFQRERVDLYLDLWIGEELLETYDPSAPNGVGQPVPQARQQHEIRRLLEIENLEISVWHVDDLADVYARARRLSQDDFPRIKRGLRAPTKGPVLIKGPEVTTDPEKRKKPFMLMDRSINATKLIDEIFPTPMDAMVRHLPLDLAPGVYELQVRLVLQEYEDRNRKWPADAALRFWVAERAGIERIETIGTEQRTSFRHEATETLRTAVKQGDIEALTRAIRAGADIDATGDDGATALAWAASKGHTDAVVTLLDAGADWRWQSARGQTPLNVAAAQGHIGIMRKLLEAGADVDERIEGPEAPDDLKGGTPLFLAAREGRRRALRTLLAEGAEVDATNALGATALFLAAERGKKRILRDLLEAGAAVEGRDKRGATPLFMAVQPDDPEVLLLLVDAGTDINARTLESNPAPYGGMTPLALAAYAERERSTATLLLAGADPSIRTADNRSALELAAQVGNEEIMAMLREREKGLAAAGKALAESLLDAAMEERWEAVALYQRHGLDLDRRDEDGLTILMQAVEEQRPAVAKGLLKAGADPNQRDAKSGGTALMRAVAHADIGMGRILLAAGADPNARASGGTDDDIVGWTALMIAADRGEPAMVRQLLDAGADADKVNRDGDSALALARRKGHAEVASLLAGSR